MAVYYIPRTCLDQKKNGKGKEEEKEGEDEEEEEEEDEEEEGKKGVNRLSYSHPAPEPFACILFRGRNIDGTGAATGMGTGATEGISTTSPDLPLLNSVLTA